jgi:hypothetical protein
MKKTSTTSQFKSVRRRLSTGRNPATAGRRLLGETGPVVRSLGKGGFFVRGVNNTTGVALVEVYDLH